MAAQFVTEIPTVEIIDGMVHTRMGDCEWFWKPSTFRLFVEAGRRELAAFDREVRGVVPFERKG